MKPTPPTTSPLTLFDAAEFEFETDPGSKAPARPPPVRTRVAGIGSVGSGLAPRATRATADATAARRRRSRARLAKRRYLVDRDGYERMEQARRGLHLVSD